jgi:hypothetical protein
MSSSVLVAIQDEDISRKCPILPVMNRMDKYRTSYTEILQILQSDAFRNPGCEDCCKQISAMVDAIPLSYINAHAPEFRSLITDLVNMNLVQALYVFYRIVLKFNGICKLESDNGELPLHEIIRAHSKMKATIVVAITKMLTEQYPEALYHKNKEGYIPLHCFLMNHVVSEHDYTLLLMLIQYHPTTAHIPTKDDKLALHLIMKFHEPCLESVRLIVESYPAAATMEAVDEVLRIDLSDMVDGGAAMRPSTRRKVHWNPISRAAENGDFAMYDMILNTVAHSGYQRIRKLCYA